MASAFGDLLNSASKWDPKILFNLRLQLDDAQKKHLAKVYQLLGVSLLSSALGAYIHVLTGIGGMWSTVVAIVLMVVLTFGFKQSDFYKRSGVLIGFGFFQGLSLGGLIQQAIDIDPTIVVTALLATVTIFVVFTLMAIRGPADRQKFFASGVLGSFLSCLCVIHFTNMYWQNEILDIAQIYFGLFVFIAYVVADTQMILEDVRNKKTDVVWHACELFVNFLAIFVRLLIILTKLSSESKDEDDDNDDDDDRKKRSSAYGSSRKNR